MNHLVVEGRLVDPDWGPRWGQVEICQGTITRVGDLGLRPDLKFSDSELVFPGFVDVHVHLRQGDEHKEDYQTATRAALQGGICCMLDMPNNPVPPLRVEDLPVKQERVVDLPIDIGFYLGVGPGSRPSGHRHYKAYMGPSIGPLFFHDDDELEEAVRHYRGCRLTFHCEDPQMLRDFADRAEHEEQRPPEAEQRAVETALRLARRHGFLVHVAHLSQADSLGTLLQASRELWPDDQGLPGVVWEVTPHHLYFDRENRRHAPRNGFLKMNPPLRHPEHRQRLLQAVLDDQVTFLSTDHAPHTVEEKSGKNPSGVPLLDTHGAFAAWLLHQGLSPRQLCALACERPGRFSGLPVGRLRPGYRGHLAVLDPNRPWTVRAEELHTRCGWSPFEGLELPGRVTCTVASGRVFRAGLEVT